MCIEEEVRITYIGSEGKAFWHGKLSTLKRTHKFAEIIKIEPITPEIFNEKRSNTLPTEEK